MNNRVFFVFFMLAAMVQGVAAQSRESDLENREKYLEQLLTLVQPEHPEHGRITRLDSTWRDWLERTGELPPDFDRLPSLPFLPDPLVLDEGGGNVPVATAAQWERKREWIKGQVKHWITGTFPPPPNNLAAGLLAEKKEGSVTSRLVELRFGPGRRAVLTVELLIPPGDGPFPVFVTQWNHRGWALVAVRRGYVGCVYAGADAKDDTEGYADLWYPEYDFTRLMRRAWGAHRAVDYLYSLPFVDKGRIGLTGHSRNGKQSLMAAAFDERIAAVISSSGGTGAEDPWRYTSEKYDNESISDITTWFPFWLHPRLRFFIGREHKLPVDQNLLMALVATRGLMLSSAITEHQGNPWGIEQNYRSLSRVYGFLGEPDRLAIRLRHGRHGTSARDIEAYVDFFDSVFGRKRFELPNTLYYNYSFDRWRELSRESIDPLGYPEKGPEDLTAGAGGRRIASVQGWERERQDITGRVGWLLGEEPAGGLDPGPGEFFASSKDDYLGGVIGRPEPGEKMGRTVIGPYRSFGDYLYGSLYYPADTSGKPSGDNLPAVIFLHEYAYPTGFARRIQPFFENLVGRGFAVFAFDMIGFGTRIEEGTLFYERYPHWSKLGRMVADVRGALDLLGNLEFIDSSRIYAAGYSLGATVGLFSAALDSRLAGAASVCGFTPLRTATAEKGIEGIRAFSHLHGLLPRAGFFVGQEERLPVDFQEILASIAPRPLLLVAPELDRDACFTDVRACMQQVSEVYGLYAAEDKLEFLAPVDFSHFDENRQQEVIHWLETISVRR
ncbi:MAG: alpha/beta fold hydrolase [Candidatus Glassbacteria bacterium]|nr:alpha/beta fold hydrolase [Candidatus Glassbacteria bacterium]